MNESHIKSSFSHRNSTYSPLEEKGEGSPSMRFPSPFLSSPSPSKVRTGSGERGQKKGPFHLLLLLGGRVKKRERGAFLPKRLSPLETPVAGKAREGERTKERGCPRSWRHWRGDGHWRRGTSSGIRYSRQASQLYFRRKKDKIIILFARIGEVPKRN